MKKLFLLLVASGCFVAQAQTQELIGKKTRKKASKTSKVKPAKSVVAEPEHIQSRNGTMKVHYIDKNEVLDTTAQPGGEPSHINRNYNENQPALSPSNGSK